jgi:prepilin-type N-terminal cleavage/methylation domain-containing protein
MKKKILQTLLPRKGFTLLELVLAVAIFSMSALATGYLIIESMSTTDANSKKIQATFLAREGLEAVRIIRDRDGNFDSLANGDHGLEFDEDDDTWRLNDDASDITDEVYERTITISDWDDGLPVGAVGKLITSTVSVPTITRDITVSLQTVLTNWPEL